jgi:hypothetical protein
VSRKGAGEGGLPLAIRSDNGVKTPAVDLHHLEFVPVQVHRMRHRRLVDEMRSTRPPLAIGNGGASLVQGTPLIDQT